MSAELIGYIKEAKLFAFDMEYELFTPEGKEQNYWNNDFELHGVSFAVLVDGNIYAEYITDKEQLQTIFTECFNKEIEAVAHFAKADYQCIKAAGYIFEDPLIRCTGIALNLLEEERHSYGLKVITPEYLGYELTPYDVASECGLDSDEFREYATEDAVACLRHYLSFKPQLIEQDLWDVYELICPSLMVFGDMELAGFKWDIEHGEDLFNKFCALRDNLQEEIYRLIGRIDLNSPKQLEQRLYRELGYTANNLQVSDKTGSISTGTENMQKLGEKYPACEAIMAYRTCSKMISTYVEPLTMMSLTNDDERIHALFWLTSKTGRTRCSKPNIQNCPNALGKNIKFNATLKTYFDDLKIRQGFVAGEGRKLVVADYSSLEYRTAAIAAPAPKLQEIYKHWECDKCGDQGSDSQIINQCTSCGNPVTQGKDLHAENRDISNSVGAGIDRSQAKAVSFLSIFGGGSWRLSKDLGLTVKTCDDILASVLGKFPGLKQWHLRTEKVAHSTGEVRDMFGRRRKINLKERLKGKPSDKAKGITKNAINELVNFVAQCPGSILTQLAAQNIRTRCIKEGIWGLGEGQMILVNMVHDELVGDACETIADYSLELIKHEMETCCDIGVPLPVSACIVENWNEAK